MGRKILIFGGSGFIGGNIVQKALENWDVSVASRSRERMPAEVNWHRADISSKGDVKELFETLKPDACVNAAALSQIDRAEENKDLAWKINVDGAENVAAGCRAFGSRHIYFSSDAVYDGRADIYMESDLPDPVNYYGKTKAAAEKIVLSLDPESVVIRISLVLGFPVTDVPSFYTNLKDKLQNPGVLYFPNDEYRTPVDVQTLSECVVELIEKDFRGILHLGSTDHANRYELACMIAEMMGFEKDRVGILTPDQGGQKKAPRHKNGIIDVSKARGLLDTPLLSVEEGVRRTFDKF
ncbi:MAG: SDR family oxidoreductase [Planctomycetota bacterium]|jgi:dTDP-4-dehydrorhamnose reductase